MSASTETTIEIGDYTPNVAIVTGAAQGIGRAIALRLADDGFDVTVNDIPPQKERLDELVELIKTKGKKALAVTGDVSVEADVERLVAETTKELGGVDVMVANAGISISQHLLDLDIEKFDKVIAVNLRGVMLCYKHAAKQMVAQKRGGRLLAASSIFGKKGTKYFQAYSATKFAVRGISQSVAQELLPYKITVNTYAPGVILTEMTNSPHDAKLGGKHGAASKAIFGVPLDSPEGYPEDIASFVSYICKPESHFINGQSVGVCGGLVMT